ncbi:hypothetical protein GCM10023116_26350 [Kistimonas scapharcae]|uniref:Cysteine dioxygenase n=2 Tax=Kistimonas scapharcae TaxID=1036133 RepID=A0ABP8V386_9GAMM
MLGLVVFPFGVSATDNSDAIKTQFSEVVSHLITKGVNKDVSGRAIPQWVWRHLGENLKASTIHFSSLYTTDCSKTYQRIVIFRSDDYPEFRNKTVPFAIVAIVLCPGQKTVTHDHNVECGPLLVNGEITEMYGYTDYLVNTGTKIAILDKQRKLEQYHPIQYFLPDQDNTHRLQEASGDKPAIALNLYVDAQGNSIKDRFPNLLRIDNGSGAEWWLE